MRNDEALRKAIKEKIFTHHRRLNLAHAFICSQISSGIMDFDLSVVPGLLPAEADQIVREFNAACTRDNLMLQIVKPSPEDFKYSARWFEVTHVDMVG